MASKCSANSELDKRTKKFNEQGFAITRSVRDDAINAIAKGQFTEVINEGAVDIGDQSSNAISKAEGILSALEEQIPNALAGGKSRDEVIRQLKRQLKLTRGEARALLDDLIGEE